MNKIILFFAVLLAGIFGASAAYAQFGGGMLIGAARPAPTLSAILTADQTTISSGSSTTLRWNSTGFNPATDACVGTGFSTGNALSGSVSTGALTTTTIYSITCTQGTAPSGGAPSPPPEAVAAGYTTLAQNYDWTVLMPAGWYSCVNPPTPATLWTSSPAANTCTMAHELATDPANPGTPVLDWRFDAPVDSNPTDFTGNKRSMHEEVGGYPAFMAYEITMRVSPDPGPDYPATNWGVAFWMPGNNVPGFVGLEIDMPEIQSGYAPNGCALNAIDWSGTRSSIIGAGKCIYDPFVKHTYTTVITGNVSNMHLCVYVDHANPHCIDYVPTADQTNILRGYLVISNGPKCNATDGDASCVTAFNAVHMYITNVHVWGCPSWATTSCAQ